MLFGSLALHIFFSSVQKKHLSNTGSFKQFNPHWLIKSLTSSLTIYIFLLLPFLAQICKCVNSSWLFRSNAQYEDTNDFYCKKQTMLAPCMSQIAKLITGTSSLPLVLLWSFSGHIFPGLNTNFDHLNSNDTYRMSWWSNRIHSLAASVSLNSLTVY